MTDPSPKRYSVAIIGSGVSGIVAGVQLQRQLGVKDFIIIEKSKAGWGGTWNKNTYPEWSKKWPSQPEIQAYFEKVANENDLPRHATFGTEVVSGTWNEKEANWTLRLRADDNTESFIIAKAVISGVGQLNNPAYPNIQGLDSFNGPVVHSANWDHDIKYDNRIAMVGTGASAIQILPELVKTASKIYVYQRSPAYIIPRGNFKYSAMFKWTCRNIPFFNRIYRVLWLLALDRNFVVLKTWIPFASQLATMYLRLLIRLAVKDTALRKKLTPDYLIGCKRLLISDDWFNSLQKPNTSLVVDPIIRVEYDAVIVKNEKGEEEKHVVDTIVLGTGFKATGFLEPMEFVGRNGISLRKTWKDGAQAYKGFAVAEFPNLFVLYGPNTNLGHNSIIFMIESTMNSVIACLRDLLDKKNPTPYICVKKSVQESYNQTIQNELSYTTFASDCASWYREKSGRITTQWSGFSSAYWWMTLGIRSEDFEQVGNKPFVNAKAAELRANIITYSSLAVLAAVSTARFVQ
ncbi:hypothetical protein HDU67_009185 [Dinochytrium kinnereticum]|nr:hypothetical protein HDU67_009185 [Dinochytrium kinnereticum]